MNILRRNAYWATLALLVYMPFHVLLSQSLSLLTGHLDIWKIAKDIFTLILAAVCALAVWYFRPKEYKLFNKLVILAAVYLILHLLLYRVNHVPLSVAALATVYNNRLVWYLLIGLSAALLIKTKPAKVVRLVLIISSLVCALGVLQYFLPKDILTHAGYTLARGVKPAFFIDDKPNLPRIMSTLRDPNSLGAYLILPITLITGLILQNKQKHRWLFGALALHTAALMLTFSRSAWFGAALSAGLIIYFEYRSLFNGFFKKYWLAILAGFLILAGGAFIFRNEYYVQNIIVHSDQSTRAEGSTQKHATQIEAGIKGIAERPLGHGPGTAGLVSIHNPGGGLLTENYYLQIGYEVGLIGLALFIGLQIFIYKRLSAFHSPLSASLLASFWGLLICALLLHTWSNEAVAAQWWLLAGAASV